MGDAAAKPAMIAPPPTSGFRLTRYFTVASLAAFVLFAAALLYLARLEDDFHTQVQQEQNAFFAQVQEGFAKQQDETARRNLLTVYEAGNVNLTRLFANALWAKDFAPFVAKVQRIPVDRCRAVADVKDAGGKTVQPAGKKACFAGIGKQIMAFPEFQALDAKVFDTMQQSTVFKIKVYDLRGITVYSSEHSQIGEDKLGNAGWKSAVAGRPASQLTHREKFSAFEGVVEHRDLIEIYVPVRAPGSGKIVGVFETYSDVTPFLEQIKNTSSQIKKLSAENRAQLERAAAANEAKDYANAILALAIIFGLLGLLYCALYLIVRHGQRVIDKEKVEREQAEARLRHSEQRYRNILQASMDAFGMADAEGRLIDVNDAFCCLIGYPRVELLKMCIQDVEAMESPEDTARHLREIMAKGEDRFETRLRRKDGELRDVELSVNFISEQERGRIVAFMRDITERKNQEQKIARLSRIHAVMSAINSLIVRVSDRQKLFEEACRIAVEHGRFGMAGVSEFDPKTLDVTPIAYAGIGTDVFTGSKSTARADVPLGQGVVGRAIRAKDLVFVNDLAADPDVGSAKRREAIRRGYRSLIALPLLVEGAVFGTLTLYAKEPNFFSEDELKLLTELAGDISFALQGIARQEKLDKLSRIRAVSGEINAAIVRIHEREPLLKETCRIAAEHGKFELVWVASLDTEKQEVRPVAWVGFSPDAARSVSWTAINATRGTLGEAIQTRRPAINNDIEVGLPGGILRQEAASKGCLSTVCMPLVADDKVVALCALFAPERGFFDADELVLLDELAADVSFALEYIAKEEKLNYLAYYDALTGLPNRALFDDRMMQVLRAASHEKSKTALVLIDLERFRVINDTLGRHIADGLLKRVAERLQSVIFDRDSLARVHGDVFAALFIAIKDEADVARLMDEKIIGCLNQPFTIAGQELRISMNAGVALFPGDATEPEALFSSAEAALRQAKESSDRYLFYAPKMNAFVAERLKLESKLQRALERDEFVLFYQPKVDLSTGRVAGLEALIRWNDPEGGLVMPMLFIPLIEETGMIVEVGAWAMKQAVSQYAAWQAAGLQPPPIAVNVSAVQLKRKDFVTSVEQAIAIAGKPGHGLDLEITESMIMEDIEASIEKLKIIRDLGVGISIDDFGTGHSSLRYLTRLPITALKIDRAFVQHMATNADDAAIVSTVIALARNLNLKVIAEGVETEEQRKFLQLLKCDEFQGYLFSKPVPADEVPALLTR